MSIISTHNGTSKKLFDISIITISSPTDMINIDIIQNWLKLNVKEILILQWTINNSNKQKIDIIRSTITNDTQIHYITIDSDDICVPSIALNFICRFSSCENLLFIPNNTTLTENFLPKIHFKNIYINVNSKYNDVNQKFCIIYISKNIYKTIGGINDNLKSYYHIDIDIINKLIIKKYKYHDIQNIYYTNHNILSVCENITYKYYNYMLDKFLSDIKNIPTYTLSKNTNYNDRYTFKYIYKINKSYNIYKYNLQIKIFSNTIINDDKWGKINTNFKLDTKTLSKLLHDNIVFDDIFDKFISHKTIYGNKQGFNIIIPVSTIEHSINVMNAIYNMYTNDNVNNIYIIYSKKLQNIFINEYLKSLQQSIPNKFYVHNIQQLSYEYIFNYTNDLKTTSNKFCIISPYSYIDNIHEITDKYLEYNIIVLSSRDNNNNFNNLLNNGMVNHLKIDSIIYKTPIQVDFNCNYIVSDLYSNEFLINQIINNSKYHVINPSLSIRLYNTYTDKFENTHINDKLRQIFNEISKKDYTCKINPFEGVKLSKLEHNDNNYQYKRSIILYNATKYVFQLFRTAMKHHVIYNKQDLLSKHINRDKFINLNINHNSIKKLANEISLFDDYEIRIDYDDNDKIYCELNSTIFDNLYNLYIMIYLSQKYHKKLYIKWIRYKTFFDENEMFILIDTIPYVSIYSTTNINKHDFYMNNIDINFDISSSKFILLTELIHKNINNDLLKLICDKIKLNTVTKKLLNMYNVKILQNTYGFVIEQNKNIVIDYINKKYTKESKYILPHDKYNISNMFITNIYDNQMCNLILFKNFKKVYYDQENSFIKNLKFLRDHNDIIKLSFK
jgi:hypothetical protein